MDIKARYHLVGNDELTIIFDDYNQAFELVIDPDLRYSTYLGGKDSDYGKGIDVDKNGNVYVTGYTASTNFPTTSGVYQTTHQGGTHVIFVTKLNVGGSSLIYSTFLGGIGYDYGWGIAVDEVGNAYVTGQTSSTNFPVSSGAFQKIRGKDYDAFVTKLNSAGSSLLYSTYLGGNGGDYGYGIAVDVSGSSHDWADRKYFLPSVIRSVSENPAGYLDAFITKLNAGGSSLLYSTFWVELELSVGMELC